MTDSQPCYVSEWVKANRGPVRKCAERGCAGSVYWCGSRWAGDADWAIHRCDTCGGGFESAGHWHVAIPPDTQWSEHRESHL